MEMERFKRGAYRRHGNRNHTQRECSTEKLEEMQWSVVRHEDDSETEVKGAQNSGQTRRALLYGAETWATTRGQEA